MSFCMLFEPLNLINRLIVTESYFWRLIVAESRTINMDSLLPGIYFPLYRLAVVVAVAVAAGVSLLQHLVQVAVPCLLPMILLLLVSFLLCSKNYICLPSRFRSRSCSACPSASAATSRRRGTSTGRTCACTRPASSPGW